jgi:multicomponent Na+:H+ antiporter subunit D
MIQHLPIFLLITPVLAALLVSMITLLSKKEVPQKIITGVAVLLPFLYLFTIFQNLSTETFIYNVGGWEEPFGITLIIDELSFILLAITAILVLLSYLYSLSSVKTDTGKFYFFFLLLTMGLNGIFISADIFNIYIFFDIICICSYILITFGDNRFKFKASFNYLILGTLASLLLLLGIGIIYAETGVLNLEYIAKEIPTISSQTQISIFLLLFAAVAIKSAIIPFHTWLVAAHSTAPTPISALLSGIIVKTGIYLFLRFNSFGFTAPRLGEIIILLGAITAVGGAVGAVMQWDIKRITAYSTISQIGFIVVGIGSLSTIGLAGSIYHMVNHAFFKALLFLCAGAIIYKTGTRDIREQRIGWNMPITLFMYIIGILAVSGITPFSGSVSKTLIETAVADNPFIALLLILASIGTVACFAKILYFSVIRHVHKEQKKKTYDDVPLPMLLPMVFLGCFCLFLGIYPEAWLDRFILPAASVLPAYIPFQIPFIEPFLLIKEWGIVAGGLVLLYCIIRFSPKIDIVQEKLSKITMNQSILAMVLVLILISIALGMLPAS